jgi:hypothetical protein
MSLLQLLIPSTEEGKKVFPFTTFNKHSNAAEVHYFNYKLSHSVLLFAFRAYFSSITSKRVVPTLFLIIKEIRNQHDMPSARGTVDPGSNPARV